MREILISDLNGGCCYLPIKLEKRYLNDLLSRYQASLRTHCYNDDEQDKRYEGNRGKTIDV